MIDGGGGNGSGPLGKYGSAVPMLLAQAIEPLRAVGLDLPAILTPEKTAGTGDGAAPAALDRLAEEVEASSASPLDPPSDRSEASGL